MYFDGSLMKTGASTGLLFISSLGVHMRYVIRLHFAASNNVAKYEALVNGLHIAIELGVRHLDVQGDSQLIIDQVMVHIRERLSHDLGQTSTLPELGSALNFRDGRHPQRHQDTVGLTHLLNGFSPYLTLCQPLWYGRPLPRGAQERDPALGFDLSSQWKTSGHKSTTQYKTVPSTGYTRYPLVVCC
jgi:hypothetical protein